MTRPTCALLLGITLAAAVAAQPRAAKPEEVVKAEALFRDGKFDDAFKMLQDAAKKHPQLPPAKLMLARLLFGAGQRGPGRMLLEQAVAENFTHPEVYLSNASEALAEGRFTDTILNCQTALALAGAERWTAEQKKTFQREARAGLSAAFEARGDWEAARNQLLALLEFETKNAGVRQRLARALFMLGRDTESLNELQQTVKDEPTVEPAEVVMGRFWSQKGDAKKAEEWLQKAVQKFPKDARAHRVFAGWLLDRGRLDAAKIHIDTALQLEPKSRDGQALRGLLLRYQKDYDGAAKIFDEIVREEPGNFFASNHLALSLVELPNRRDRAVQLAEINARVHPRAPDAAATLGWIYFKTGRLVDAERLLAAVSTAGQVSPDVAYYLANVQKDTGKVKEAKEVLKKALESDSPFINRADAKALLEKLNKP